MSGQKLKLLKETSGHLQKEDLHLSQSGHTRLITMGIPYYFASIVHTNPSILTQRTVCNRLYLDFNSVIHGCSANVINKLIETAAIQKTSHVKAHTPQVYQSIFKDIIRHVDTICAACAPSDLLYIAVDGVAPLAKINQQRKRRFLTSFRNDRLLNIRKNHNMVTSDWDSNCITAGTQFMADLCAYLKDHYNSQKVPYKVIVSGSDEQGEGEHKMISYMISANESTTTDQDINVIYGLDADLIMLSLCADKSNIFLMRETQIMCNTQGRHSHHEYAYKYLDIDKLKLSIVKMLYGGHHKDYIDYMKDYVFICFLLGNDFLPHNSFLSIKHGGVNILCDAYRKIHKEIGEHIILSGERNRKIINMAFLSMLFDEIAKEEHLRMKTYVNEYMNKEYIEKKSNNNVFEKKCRELEAWPLFNKCTDVYNTLISESLWKMHYYQHLHGINGFKDYQEVDNVCACYVKGLMWNVDYYFNRIYNHKWFFVHDFAPLFSDLSLYMHKNDHKQIVASFKSMNDITISPLEQLLLVLPITSNSLIPSPYNQLMTRIEHGCLHMYPVAFKINGFLKSQLWECTPVLPCPNVLRVKKAIASAVAVIKTQ